MPETIGFSVRFAVIGIAIVFCALTIIAAVVAFIRRLDQRWQEREAAARQAQSEREPSIDAITLVLISAAVATLTQGRFHIKRVRRLLPRQAVRGVWSLQGRAVLHGSHVLPRKR